MDTVQKLQNILKATGWSQETLASKLGVSFVTINTWINNKSLPRSKASRSIDKLYNEIIGYDVIDPAQLENLKKHCSNLKNTARDIVKDKQLLDRLTLYLTYHTNTIEGSTMTLSDVQDVLLDNKVLSNRTAIEQAEARNHQAALHWILDILVESRGNVQLSEDLILNIHLRLMNGILSDAGKYRSNAVRIAGSRTILANHLIIALRMSEFCDKYNHHSDNLVEKLAKMHAEFEQIHPFSDGNGRTGRLLLLLIALQNNTTPPLIIKEKKYAYYKYLELAQTKKQYEPLEYFIADAMVSASMLLGE